MSSGAYGPGLPPVGGWKRHMVEDPEEYSPEFQDEYRRLWHKAAADLAAARAREQQMRPLIEAAVAWASAREAWLAINPLKEPTGLVAADILWRAIEDFRAALADQPAADERPDFVLTLRWTCQACGWSTVMDAPGFAGDGHLHYPDGEHGCGPVTAQKADGYPIPRDATPASAAADEPGEQ